jgi:hypothetical protein
LDIYKSIEEIAQIAMRNLVTTLPHGMEVIDYEWMKVLDIIKEITFEQEQV